MSNPGNTSNPLVDWSSRLRQLSPRTLFLVLAVPFAVLIIWVATRTGTMKKAADLERSVSHPSSLISSATKPKPPAGKLMKETSTPAPLPPAADWSKIQASNSASTVPAQGGAPVTSAPPSSAPIAIGGMSAPPPISTSGRPAYAPLSYNARHEKAFGGCSGQLVLSSAGLQFNCPSDTHSSMQIALSDISAVDENGVRLTSGKKLHFSIAGMTKPSEQAIFADWFNRLH